MLLYFVFLMPCDCNCSVAFPYGAVGLSAVCDYPTTIYKSMFAQMYNFLVEKYICTILAF